MWLPPLEPTERWTPSFVVVRNATSFSPDRLEADRKKGLQLSFVPPVDVADSSVVFPSAVLLSLFRLCSWTQFWGFTLRSVALPATAVLLVLCSPVWASAPALSTFPWAYFWSLGLCYVLFTVYSHSTTHINTLTGMHLLCEVGCVIWELILVILILESKKTGIKQLVLASASFTKESRSSWQMVATEIAASCKLTVTQYILTL